VRAELELCDQPRTCRVEQLEPLHASIYPAPHQAATAQLRHTFELRMGARYTVRLSS
jgi:hypothetical protein